MPPKVKFTKERIASVAFDMVRKHGSEFLSARSLAAELGASTAPIFTAFQSIEEVQQAVISKAKELYNSYINKAFSAELPFKETGMQYIRFAADEPELFKLLFMRAAENERISHFFPAGEALNVHNDQIPFSVFGQVYRGLGFAAQLGNLIVILPNGSGRTNIHDASSL